MSTLPPGARGRTLELAANVLRREPTNLTFEQRFSRGAGIRPPHAYVSGGQLAADCADCSLTIVSPGRTVLAIKNLTAAMNAHVAQMRDAGQDHGR